MARTGVAPCAILALLALSSVEARDLLGLNGHRNGVAFSDLGQFYTTNGNGSWIQRSDSMTVVTTGDYVGTLGSGVMTPTFMYPFNGPQLPPLDYAANDYAGTPLNGIRSVAFPSKTLGIAVGMNYAPFGQAFSPVISQGAVTPTGSVVMDVNAVGFQYDLSLPTILASFDGGDTWTGINTVTPKSPGASIDLNAVFCASKLLCWAVGGRLQVGNAADMHSAAILISTNGGTSWSYSLCPAFFNDQSNVCSKAGGATCTYTDDCPASFLLAPMGSSFVTTLWDIASDSSGQHVYAVGSFGVPTSSNIAIQNAPILYSGNSGVSWVIQTTPAFSAVSSYDLVGITVATGKVAFACGGSMRPGLDSNGVAGNKYPGNYANGLILMTTNGGFSWSPQIISANFTGFAKNPLAAKGTPPLTDIAFNRNKNNNSAVWAVGMSFFDTPSNFQTAYGDAISKSKDILPCYSVFYATLANGVNSINGTLTFNLAPASSMPSSYATSNACGQDLYGIVWDNTMHGWIFGATTILVTQNGGLTWQYETPNSLIVSTPQWFPNNIFAMANVPSNY